MSKEFIRSDRSLTERNLILIGYTCSEGDWQIENPLELWQALNLFTQHVKLAHPTGYSHLLRIYTFKKLQS